MVTKELSFSKRPLLHTVFKSFLVVPSALWWKSQHATTYDLLPAPCYQGQVTQKEYRDVVHHYREKICVAKGQLEFKLASTMKDNKKGCFK